MELENTLEREKHLDTNHQFLGSMLVFGGVSPCSYNFVFFYLLEKFQGGQLLEHLKHEFQLGELGEFGGDRGDRTIHINKGSNAKLCQV